MKKIFVAGILALGLFFSWKLRLYNRIIGYTEGYWQLKNLKAEINNKHFNPVITDSIFYAAHAGGGIDGKTYLNTLNAINRSYSKGYKFIELDINITKDSTYVLSHEYVDSSTAKFLKDSSRGSHMTLDELMFWLKNKNVKIITDIKVDNIKILNLISKKYPFALEKIIPQTYHISEIIPANKLGYNNIIFTNYVARYPANILNDLAKTKILFGITIPYSTREYNTLLKENCFYQSPTPYFVHTLNDTSITNYIKKRGVKGIYTDFILPSGSDK